MSDTQPQPQQHLNPEHLAQLRQMFPQAWQLLQPQATQMEGNCRSAQVGQLCKAMAAAQGEIRAALRDRTVKMKVKSKKDDREYDVSYSYADLAEIYEACRAPLAKAGIAIFQLPVNKHAGAVTVVTFLGHESDQWVQGEISLRLERADDPKALGSAITYLRRYSIGAMVGVVTEEDDDGGAAMPEGQQRGKSGQKGETNPALQRRQQEQGSSATATGQGQQQNTQQQQNGSQAQQQTKAAGSSEKPKGAASPSTSTASASGSSARASAAASAAKTPDPLAQAKNAAWAALSKVDKVYVAGNVAKPETIEAANVRLAKWGYPALAECSAEQLQEITERYTRLQFLLDDLREKIRQVDAVASDVTQCDWVLTMPVVAERLAEWGKGWEVDLLTDGEAVLEQIDEGYLEMISAKYDGLILDAIESEKAAF